MANKLNNEKNRVLAEVDRLIRQTTEKECVSGTFPVYFLFKHLKKRGFSRKYKLEIEPTYSVMYVTRGRLTIQIFIDGADAFSRGFTLYTE